MPLKIYLASSEINYRALKDTPTKNWLVSFYYLRKMGNKLEPFLEDAKHGLKRLGVNEERSLFLDSGAFSFQNAHGCISGRTNKDKTELNTIALLKYSLDYLEFIKKYKHYFDIIVEVDVDYIIGQQKTRYMFERMRNDGVDIRPVWHIPRGMDRWEEDCKRFDYHGIEGQTRHRDDPQSFYNQMLEISHKYNAKVHGFAMTSEKLLHQVQFDSVDSASWMLQAAQGTVKTPMGTVIISDRAEEKAEVGDNMNYFSMKPYLQKEFEAYVKSKGFTIDGLVNEWKDRAALNTYYYTWLENSVNAHWGKKSAPKTFQTSLFNFV